MMYIYRALNNETKLYNIGIIIADTKESAKEKVCNYFDINTHTIYIFSEENICDYFSSSIIKEECVDINELCFKYGYRTENELKLQNKLNAIQPLINDLALFRD